MKTIDINPNWYINQFKSFFYNLPIFYNIVKGKLTVDLVMAGRNVSYKKYFYTKYKTDQEFNVFLLGEKKIKKLKFSCIGYCVVNKYIT